jgi:Zn-dependent protease/predicted transcriptional regulator
LRPRRKKNGRTLPPNTAFARLAEGIFVAALPSMRGALRLGRLFGIDIVVDWSWAFVVLLMSWNLTTVFLRWHPTWTLGASFFLAVVAVVLFFASVLAHELAHALVAGSFGVRVREIRLFLFGGVANLDREPPSAGAEFWTAIVGPLVSFGLGVAFVAATAALMLPADIDPTRPWETLARLGPIATIVFWLGPVNLIVGVFNLIPGFPLDGGRVLRAILWRATGDLRRATRASSSVGRGIGWIFIMMGIAMVFGAKIPFFGQGPVSGMWLAFIGWFLSSAAERSYTALLVQDVLTGVRVSMIMRRSGWTVPAETTVSSLVNDWFMRSSERCFPVLEDGRIAGVVCMSDVRNLPRESWSRAPVTAIMTPTERLAVASPDEDAASALRKLGERDVDQLPVLDGDRLVGMFTRAEVARWLELHVGQPRIGAPRAA